MKRSLILVGILLVDIIVAFVPVPATAAAPATVPSLWQRFVGALTPQPSEPATAARARRHATKPPIPRPRQPEPTSRSSTAAGCNGGHRIVSAYYWEGHHTASGAPFNPHGMTAAHRTLPFGTRLAVTNPRTGKSVVVVINDRGPYVRGVSLDLSLGAAQAIGMHGTGTVCIP